MHFHSWASAAIASNLSGCEQTILTHPQRYSASGGSAQFHASAIEEGPIGLRFRIAAPPEYE
jgi:hypothetical protein